MAFLAEHDPLTGLTNRSFFQSALEHALARARRAGDRVAVLFLDLDGFKRVNDRFGHEAGDKLLQEVARRLVACLREQDTVARLGGDEFLVLIEGLRSADHATVVARSIRRALARPVEVGGHRTTCSASIGCAISPPNGKITPSTLIARADAAMYRAKSRASTEAAS
jgi:diguanylate cyclase (GGDEF)-like protein